MEREQLLKTYNTEKYMKLVISVVIDLLGMASFTIPGLGEFSDLIWGPISGLATFLLFRGKIGLAGGTFNAIEESIPFTDIIPGVTITWFIKYVVFKKQTLEEFLVNKQQEKELIEKYIN